MSKPNLFSGCVKRNDLPTNWSDLPVEMQEEVLARVDFVTLCRLRHCSSHLKRTIDSLPISIPILKLTTIGHDESISFIYGKGNHVRVDLLWRIQKHVIHRYPKIVVRVSSALDGSDGFEIAANLKSYSSVLECLFRAVFRSNVQIGTVLMDVLDEPDRDLKIMLSSYLKNCTIRPRIIGVGTRFLTSSWRNSLVFDDVRIISDKTDPRHQKLKLYTGTCTVIEEDYVDAIHHYEKQYFDGKLKNLIQALLANPLALKHFYWIPKTLKFPGRKLTGPKLSKICEEFNGTMQTIPNVQAIAVPIVDFTESHARFLLVKVSTCGVMIEVVTDASKKHLASQWMCSHCEKSAESWYFRSLLGIEE